MKSTSLQSFLQGLETSKPADFDPEHEGFGFDTADRASEVPDHYAEVGTSKLRKSAAPLDGTLYIGEKASRQQLYKDSASEEEDEEIDDSEIQDSNEEEDLPFGPVESDSSSGQQSADEQSEGSEESDEEIESDQDGEQEEAPTKKSKGESSMATQLQQAAKNDLKKGQDIKKQLSFWDSILEMRVKIQPALEAVNSIDTINNANPIEESPANAQTIAALLQLNEALFQLRNEIIRRNSVNDLPPRKKRKIDDTVFLEQLPEDVEASTSELAALDKAYEPVLSSTIIKWSDKVSAASMTALKSANKFNNGRDSALFKNTWQQIQHALVNDKDRLVARTRIRRGAHTGGLSENSADLNVFDDFDFYQHLLKEAVDNQILDVDDPAMAAMRAATLNRNQAKKIVDTKASKGRKLRYKVHDKLQNFMVPIQTRTWSDSQMDELFSSLLGRRITQTAQLEPGETNVVDVSDGFRLI